jgi:fucose 4-O-acetylase-like acetyltransferase
MSNPTIERPQSGPKSGSQSGPPRLGWVDYAKGIGIFLVVFGHALRAFPPPGPALTVQPYITLNWSIYAFHMPLFFLLSGLFLHSATRQPIGTFLRKKCATLLYPYLLWSLIYGAIQAILSPDISPIADLLALGQIPWQPIDHYWFIYALFGYSLIYLGLARLTKGPWAFLALSVALYGSYAAGIEINIEIIHRMRVNAIYLAIGAILPQIGGLKALEWPETNTEIGSTRLNDSQGILGCAGLGITGIVAVVLGVGFHLYDVPSLQPLFAAAGIMAVISIARLLDRLAILPILRQWGKLSLQIYLVHMIPMVAGRLVATNVLGLRDTEPLVAVQTLAGLYGPIALVWVADRFQLPALFTWVPRSVRL